MIWREIYVSVECVFDCRRRCWQEEGEFSPPPFEVFSSLYDFELKMYREQIHTTLAIAVLVSKTTLKRRQQPQIWTICYFFFAHTEWLVKTILNETKWFSSFARWNSVGLIFCRIFQITFDTDIYFTSDHWQKRSTTQDKLKSFQETIRSKRKTLKNWQVTFIYKR